MKKNIISAILVVVLAIMGVFFVSCNETESSSPSAQSSVETKLELSAKEKELLIGQEYKLFVISLEYKEAEITWTSSNSSVVSVEDGTLTTKGIGNTVITATAEDGASATCAVSVTTGGNVAVLDFENGYDEEIRVSVEETLNLKGYVVFNGQVYNDATLDYEVSDTSVGTVENGVFAPLAVGETMVTITASWYGVESELLSKTFTVKVEEVFVMQEVTLSAQFIEVITEGENAGTVTLDTSEMEDEVKSVSVDGANVGTSATFAYSATGRHTAVVETESARYTVPFVVADYVIRDYDDVLGLVNYYTENDEDTTDTNTKMYNKYIVLANDVTCTTVKFKHTIANTYLCESTFDGYGHTIYDLPIASGRWGLLGNLAGTTVKDFALVNLMVQNSGNSSTGLCGGVDAFSKLQNIFISGIVSKSGTNTYLMAALIQGTIENCVVIDNSYAEKSVTLNAKQAAVVGRMRTTDTTGKLTDVVVCTGGTALADNATAGVEVMDNNDTRVTDCTKVGLNDSADLIAALTALAAKDNNFTFDTATNTLYLCGNVVYTVSTVTE